MQVDKKQFERVLSYIEHGKREGATLLTGGNALDRKGYFVEPTIFTDVEVSIRKLPFFAFECWDQKYSVSYIFLMILAGSYDYCKRRNIWTCFISNEFQVSSLPY